MIDEVKNLLNEVLLYSPKNIEELEQFRIQYLGKKGKMTNLFAALKKVPKDQKKDLGQALNQLKKAIEDNDTAAQVEAQEQLAAAKADTVRLSSLKASQKRDEEYAKDNKLGLWKGTFIMPEKWRKLN